MPRARSASEWSGQSPDPATSYAPWPLFNVGCGHPVEMTEVVRLLEAALGTTAIRQLEPMQPGDVPETYADVDSLAAAIGFRPSTPIEEGIARYVEWFRGYYPMDV